MSRRIMLVAVGDANVGKTCLCMRFTQGTYEVYSPMLIDVHNDVDMEVDGARVTMTLCDPCVGNQPLDIVRKLFYQKADGFLLCFSVDNNRSYENIATKWILEVRHICPQKPFILVGTKIDLRDNTEEGSNRDNFMTRTQGENMAARINASKYVECSAKENSGLKEVFDEAVRAVLMSSQAEPAVPVSRRSHSSFRCTVL